MDGDVAWRHFVRWWCDVVVAPHSTPLNSVPTTSIIVVCAVLSSLSLLSLPVSLCHLIRHPVAELHWRCGYCCCCCFPIVIIIFWFHSSGGTWMMMMMMLGTQTLLFVVVVILTIVDEIIGCRGSNRTDRPEEEKTPMVVPGGDEDGSFVGDNDNGDVGWFPDPLQFVSFSLPSLSSMMILVMMILIRTTKAVDS